jgi:hypothetical protein
MYSQSELRPFVVSFIAHPFEDADAQETISGTIVAHSAKEAECMTYQQCDERGYDVDYIDVMPIH